MYLNKFLKLGAIGAFLPILALADHGGNNNGNVANSNGNQGFDSGVVGAVPGATIGGVMSATTPWTVGSGQASLSSSGQLQVQVQGLLLGPGSPPNTVGTVGPVQMVAASLVCGGSGGTVAASTGGVVLSSAGDAQIQAQITVPATCMAPSILVRVFKNTAPPGGQLGRFIAVSGFNRTGNNINNADNDNNGDNDNNDN